MNRKQKKMGEFKCK